MNSYKSTYLNRAKVVLFSESKCPFDKYLLFSRFCQLACKYHDTLRARCLPVDPHLIAEETKVMLIS